MLYYSHNFTPPLYMLDSILSALLPVFILIGVGYIFQKSQPREPRLHRIFAHIGIRETNSWTTVLNKYALNLALPGLILSSLISVDRGALPDATFILFTAGGLLAFMGIIVAITTQAKVKTDIANAYLFGGFFGNSAYIGFAYLLAYYANSGAILSMILAIHLIIAFTIGIIILEKTTHNSFSFSRILCKTAKNPLLLAVAAGLIVTLFGISLPATVIKAISIIGNSASPVVLIALGIFIASEWRFDDTIIHASSITVIKIIAMPLLFLAIASLLHIDLSIKLSILQAAMPVALTNFALAEDYAINKTMTANAIIISTIGSILTLPLFTWMAESLL